jgi:dimethylhistidine N-methyltransferase
MNPAAVLFAASGPAPAADAFRRDVLHGLARPRKTLPCKYFYDEAGSRLFEEICELDEYYLTRCELEILARHGPAMADAAGAGCVLVEFGSGSGRKTRLLLDRLRRPVAYVPVDINGDQLARSAARLRPRYPGLVVAPVCADFAAPFAVPAAAGGGRRVVYFSGSTIGNFRPPEVVRLLAGMARLAGPDGALLIAVDLKKDRGVLERAYNDRQGVTSAFNLNLLCRINRELGADFDPTRFRHHAPYNERRGRVEMHLVSKAAQAVHLGGACFPFREGETICTEHSYKYGLDEFRALAARVGLAVELVWTDANGWFGVQWLAAR